MDTERLYEVTVMNLGILVTYGLIGYLTYLANLPWYFGIGMIVTVSILLGISINKIVEVSILEYNAYLKVQTELAKVYERLTKEREEDENN